MTHPRFILPVVAALVAWRPVDRPTTLCVAPPTVEATPSSASDAASAVREAFSSLLATPGVRVKVLQSRLPSQARDEAREANCPFVLYTTVKHVRKNGSRGFLTGKVLGGALRAGASTAGSEVGASVSRAVGGASGRVLGSAASGATTTATNNAASALYARSVSIRDEVTLVTRLEADDGTVLVDRRDAQQAKADGEDLIATLSQRAADPVAAAISKR